MLAYFCVCETCDAPLLYDGIDPSEVDSDWPPLAYPKLTEFGSNVPGNIRTIYDQAMKCKSHAPLGFAILIAKPLRRFATIAESRREQVEKGASTAGFRNSKSEATFRPTLYE